MSLASAAGRALGPGRLGQLLRAARSTYTLSLAVKFIGAALSFGTTLIIARLAGPAVSGQFALALQTVISGMTIAVFGNDLLLTRRVASYMREGRLGHARAALRFAVRVVGRAALGVAVLLTVIGLLLDRIGAPPATILLCAVGVISYAFLMIVVVMLRVTDRVVLSQFFFGASHSLVLLVAIGVMWLSHIPLVATNIVLCFVAALTATMLAGTAIVARQVRAWPAPSGEVPRFRFTDSGIIGATTVTQMLAFFISMALIADSVGVDDVGVYRVCLQIMTVFSMIFATVDSIVGPQFASDFAVGNVAGAQKRYFRATAILALFAGAPILATIAMPAQILSVFGPYFPTGAAALQVLVFSQFVNIVTGPVGSMLIMAKQERSNFLLATTGLAIQLGLIVALVPRFGVLGAAWSLTISTCWRNLGGMVIAFTLLNRPPAARPAGSAD